MIVSSYMKNVSVKQHYSSLRKFTLFRDEEQQINKAYAKT